MKARIKATGEIIEVSQGIYSPYQYVGDNGAIYTEEQLEILQEDSSVIFIDPTIDYWTRLEHQYAGMAMQGMLNNSLLISSLLKVNKSHEDIVDEVIDTAIRYARALVEKYKKEERK